MKICVSAEEPDLHAMIAEEFGHAPFLVIYDTETGNYEAFPNKGPQTDVGAGIVAAEMVIELGAEVVLTGYVGVHGQKKLQSGNIKIVSDEEGSVWSAIQKYMKKHPECKTSPTPAKTAPPE